ncbi:hypothetical protein SDC9_162438 [bioreactor metagenome]|uniref:Uncharacterized protein n=1 Tax=bioreactor metagenome TaxID=1076179 RepID=A0A645FP27_9ZZZZ
MPELDKQEISRTDFLGNLIEPFFGDERFGGAAVLGIVAHFNFGCEEVGKLFPPAGLRLHFTGFLRCRRIAGDEQFILHTLVSFMVMLSL